MFKKFSVEWLSQSFHAQDLEQHKCVKLIPSAPDAFSDAPQASSETRGEGETKAPSSPTSEQDLLTVVFWICIGSNRLSLSSDSCGYTSESDESEGEAAPQRRVRSKFSSDQISRLEKSFSKQQYLCARQRRRTAEKLQLSETQVCGDHIIAVTADIVFVKLILIKSKRVVCICHTSGLLL